MFESGLRWFNAILTVILRCSLPLAGKIFLPPTPPRGRGALKGHEAVVEAAVVEEAVVEEAVEPPPGPPEPPPGPPESASGASEPSE